MRSLILPAVLVGCLLTAGCQQQASKAEGTEGISTTIIPHEALPVKVAKPEEFAGLLADETDAQIVDVRTEGEYSSGHLAGSMNINIASPDFHGEVSKLDTERKIYVYCAIGGRSARAAEMMANMGYEVVDMNGGITAWKSEGRETTTE
ncbi:rhodanese-like domain-containing protein [Roseivirga sp. BDSF3-8]|uniref:rhodanese-like domain-containing protein n=1 Tax=Roseivirga sp. BDSF3-8 TaxID=3241598 RepID=UPI003531BAB9